MTNKNEAGYNPFDRDGLPKDVRQWTRVDRLKHRLLELGLRYQHDGPATLEALIAAVKDEAAPSSKKGRGS